MSQVTFRTKNGFEVVAGYDEDAREYFAYVFDQRGKAYWSNLTDFDPIDKHSTERLRSRMTGFLRIEVPDGFWSLVEQKSATPCKWDGQTWR